MRFPTPAEQAAILDAFTYDAETGDIRWDRTGPRVTFGDLAGSFSPSRRLVVTLGGRQYQLSHVAWFLHHGLWPTSAVVFADDTPANLRANNLWLLEETLPPTAKAGQMRRYRDKLKEKQRHVLAKSNVPNVILSVDKTWTVRAGWDARIALATFADRDDAETYGKQCNAGYLYLQRHTVNSSYVFRNTAAETTYAGNTDLSLGEAHRRFAYDPQTGAIYHRHPESRQGTLALEHAGHRRFVVRSNGRVYSAGMLAWFLTHGEWPKRKQLAYRDNDQKNLTLSNLYLKDPENAEVPQR